MSNVLIIQIIQYIYFVLKKKVIKKYNNFLYLIEICCALCYYKNLHNNHKLIELSDIESLKKENITIESSMNEFNEISTKIFIFFLFFLFFL